MADKLQKLAVIDIDGVEYDLAANGHGALVTYDGQKDAYSGTASAQVVDLDKWLDHTQARKRVQALLDLLAGAYRQLQSSRDSKLGVGRGLGKDGGA
jgi:hypothetical protein